MNSDILKWRIIILGGVGLILFFIYTITMDFYKTRDELQGKAYSTAELIEVFYDKKVKIYELKKYFNEIIPKDRKIEIEFENDNLLSRLGIYFDTIAVNQVYGPTELHPIFLGWDLRINSPKTDSLISILGWNQTTLKKLKEKLDDANCISISNCSLIEPNKPIDIGFERNFMGLYYFKIFDKHIPDSLKNYYNKGHYTFINDTLVLECATGAI